MASQKQIFILNLLTNTSIFSLRLVTLITPLCLRRTPPHERMYERRSGNTALRAEARRP